MSKGFFLLDQNITKPKLTVGIMSKKLESNKKNLGIFLKVWILLKKSPY